MPSLRTIVNFVPEKSTEVEEVNDDHDLWLERPNGTHFNKKIHMIKALKTLLGTDLLHTKAIVDQLEDDRIGKFLIASNISKILAIEIQDKVYNETGEHLLITESSSHKGDTISTTKRLCDYVNLGRTDKLYVY